MTPVISIVIRLAFIVRDGICSSWLNIFLFVAIILKVLGVWYNKIFTAEVSRDISQNYSVSCGKMHWRNVKKITHIWKLVLTFSYSFVLFIWNLFHSKFSGRREQIQPSHCGYMMKEHWFDYWDSKRFIINPQVSSTLWGRPSLLHYGYLLSQGVKLVGRETDFTLHLVPE